MELNSSINKNTKLVNVSEYIILEILLILILKNYRKFRLV